MKIHKVCESNCTACNACITICPKHCIEFEHGEADYTFATVDEKKCINCHACERVCPNIKTVEKNVPKSCFAAWALDKKIRDDGASGGIATVLYSCYSNLGYWCAGVRMTDAFEASYLLLAPNENNRDFSNSKYVYSNTNNIYHKIENKLRDGQGVLFIGLPCQVAGLKNYITVVKCPGEKLITVDLICHGVTPEKMLKQHISHLEHRKKFKAEKVLFRDPEYKTSSYTFTLKESNQVKYAKKVKQDDCYQIGYHCGISYRENCYHCRFATPERVGDLTLSDFAYVGCIATCKYSNENVSCIIVNTQRGSEALELMKRAHVAFLEERPLDEVLEREHQLKSPTKEPPERHLFIRCYEETHDFDYAMKKAAWKIMLKNNLYYFFRVQQIKKMLVRILPKRLIKSLKEII